MAENYVTMGVPLVANALGAQGTPYAIEGNKRYDEVDAFVKAHPGEVKNMVGHSKGGAVVHTWMKNHPEFKGQSRLYSTPYDDPLGKGQIRKSLDDFNASRHAIDAAGLGFQTDPLEKYVLEGVIGKVSSLFGDAPVKGEKRIANNFDPAAVLDGSAERYDHGNPLAHLASAGPHDYHEGIARFNTGFEDTSSTERPGDVDPSYRGPA